MFSEDLLAPPESLNHIEKLKELRRYGGVRMTDGLTDAIISQFLATDDALKRAVDQALLNHRLLRDEHGVLLAMDEAEAIALVQDDYVNFYAPETVNPYIALAAAGPWIISAHGAVIHDSGGYGMLGMGHGPVDVLSTMAEPWVMANVMTPSFSHKRLGDRLRNEIGHARSGGCPFSRFVAMNSGSESVTVAARIADVNALRLTEPGGCQEGRQISFLGLTGGFHGRTDRPAQVSDSSMPTYRKHLASFKKRQNLITIEPNNIEALHEAFAQADREGLFFEAMFIEPVMGEGRPGRGVTRAFYDEARRLTTAHGSLLLVDSIQAGIRATGALSIVDYPGFEDCEAPDMETYSKALNAGQYPLSILALNERAAALYVKGIYGNTMTTNPRALEVACTVLEHLTPALRKNIQDRGVEFVDKLKALSEEIPGAITSVEGTGLLLCAELDPEKYDVIGFTGMETFCRKKGIGVIHGGKNALRFTPHFALSSAEIDVIIDVVRQGLHALA
jgi:acetylornithine/succinyldiaminopimelate/putrescine aminotransferase